MSKTQQVPTSSATGLPDEATFAEQTKELLEFSERTHAKAVMLIISFDSLVDDINDQQNDLAQKAIAERFLSRARDSDIYAHLGGMDFASLTIETSEEHVQILVEKLKNELAEPINLADGTSIKLNANIGISEFPKDGTTYQELLNIAKQ
ncbi:MAG: diguanylate cyclase [Cycloclasticus sp.]|nr:diguanylate cyclase [Cycloclasticus sp.]